MISQSYTTIMVYEPIQNKNKHLKMYQKYYPLLEL